MASNLLEPFTTTSFNQPLLLNIIYIIPADILLCGLRIIFRHFKEHLVVVY